MNKKFVVVCFAFALFHFDADAQKKENIPPPPPPKQQKEILVNDEKEYKAFLKMNPTVKSLYWKGTGRIMGVRLKSGKEEMYNLDIASELAIAESKYGSLPEPPPPPPPVPAKPSKTEIPEAPDEP